MAARAGHNGEAKLMTSIHPTKEKLIETFLALSEEGDIDKITVDEVLDRSRISKGSLYHHFENFDDLIAEAMARRYAEGVDRSIEQMVVALLGCGSKDQFLEGVRLSILQTIRPESAVFRLNRSRIIGMCANNVRLEAKVAAEQDRLSKAIEGLFCEAQKQGWVKPTLHIPAAALLVQAYTFGKVVDDIAVRPVDQEAWVELISELVINLFIKDFGSSL